MASDMRFFLEYSKRDCSCRECPTPLKKGDFRIAYLARTAYGQQSQFYHAECLFKTFTPKKKIKVTQESDVSGWNDVKKADANVVKQLIKKYSAADSTEGSTTKTKTVKSSNKRTKNEDEQDDEDEEDDDEDSTPAKAKKSKKDSKKTAKQSKTSKAATATTTNATTATATATTAPSAASTPTKSPKKRTELDAKREFRQLYAELQKGKKLTAKDFYQFSVPELKIVLKLNDRSSTGNKDALCKSVADCMVYGVPPKCPKCGGGRLRVKPNGSFYCPGYMDDDEFQNCSFTAAKDGIARLPWKNPNLN